MIRGLYTSGSGMLAAQSQSDIIGDNIANIKTPGYKAEQGSAFVFPTELINRISSDENGVPQSVPIGLLSTGVVVDRVSKINIPGTVQTTDKATDLALETPGFFVVQTAEGLRYTRNGQFQLNSAGVLQTVDGYAVLGENGPIMVNDPLSPQLTIAADGTVTDGENVIDRLRVMDIAETDLSREGQSLYSANQAFPAPAVQVRQGALEASNVDTATQMVQMITVMRAYEANQKVIQTQDATLEKAVNEVGKI
ncbi:MAG TPA: flagellar hook-basal body complex protein [Desulfitobacteriaceae bacterium]|nr:flagellar hook-basal body complex protein [Desulfitobacteriaceae bacterium]